MIVMKPTGFRMGELLTALILLIEGKIPTKSIKKNTLIMLMTSLALLIFIESTNIIWFVKAIALSFIAYVALNNVLHLSVKFILGVVSGYTLYSASLIVVDAGFLAKYSAVHCSIFLIPVLFSKNGINRIIAFVFLCVATYVAVESNSRGQIVLLISVLSFIVLSKVRLVQCLKHSVLMLSIFIGLQIASLPLKLYHLDQVMQKGNFLETNAGDLERSLLGAYALTSILEAPRGQRREIIESNSVDSVGIPESIVLQTTSAHNFIEDAIIFGGFPGLLLLFVLYRFVWKSNTISQGEFSNRKLYLTVVGISLLIISFVLATSPVAGIERLQIVLIACLLPIYLQQNHLRNNRAVLCGKDLRK